MPLDETTIDGIFERTSSDDCCADETGWKRAVKKRRISSVVKFAVSHARYASWHSAFQHRDTKELLGVHIIGEGASEILHIGQAVMTLKGTVDYFVNTVFNYPTLAECYKAAAFNGLNKLARFG